MFKKIGSLVVTAALVFSLAACGGSGNTASTTAATTAAAGDTTAAATTAAAAQEVTEYTFLMDWNGGAADWPDGFQNSPIAKAIEEKTGVRFKAETITSSEREKLAMVFASGDLPDVTNAPHWNTNPGGEGELIKNAGVEGLLLNLKGLVDKYPNIMKMYEPGIVSQTYIDKDIHNKEYKDGAFYVIPTQTARTEADVTNWAYNLFARKDILAALNITPESVTTEDAIYQLLTKIKGGNFKDINGKPVIPGSTWHNGWSYEEFLRGFNNGGVTAGWVKDGDKLVNELFTQNLTDKVLYMRKLVAEGLMDPECFTQTDTMAKEKMITGRVAMFGCHYPNEYGFFKGTLYKTNPEMEYVPLGPILSKTGSVVSQVEKKGRTGSPVLFFKKDLKDPDKLLKAIDWMNSDEGLKLLSFGIEGTHYTMDGNIPKFNDEWAKIKASDDAKFKLEGFGIGGSFIGADPRTGWGWNPDYTEAGYVHAREINPLKFIDYKTADDVVDSWDGKKAYDEKMSTTNWGDELKKAFLAKSDKEATAIIQAQQKRMKDAGYDEMVKFLNDEVAKDSKILN